MKRVLKYILSLLVAVLLVSIGVAGWLLHDQDWIKSRAGEFVTELSGRQFVIEGPVEIGLSTHPTVSAEDLRLANAPWAGEDDMVSLEKIRFSFDLLSLFSDQFLIDFIEADGLIIALAENEQGDVNWDLFPDTETAAKDQEEEDKKTRKKLPFRLDRLDLKNLRVSHEAPDRVEPLDFHLQELELSKTEDEMTIAAGHGSVGGQALDFNGRLGALKNLITGGPIELDTHLGLGEIELNVQGRVADALTGQGVDVTVKFSGPEFAWITRQLALPEFTEGPFDFDLSLEIGDYDTKLRLVGDLGNLDVNATGSVDDYRRPREGQLEFEITGPDLQLLGEALGEPNLISAPYHLKGDISEHMGDIQIHTFQFEVGDNRGQLVGAIGEWPELEDTEFDILISGPDLSQWGPVLRIEGLSSRAFTYAGRLSNKESNMLLTTNRLDLSNAEGGVEVDDTHIEVAGSLGQAPEFIGSALHLDIMTPDLSGISLIPNHESLPAVRLSIKGEVGRNEKNLLLDDLQIGLGANQATVNGWIVLSEDLLGSELKGQLTVPNLAALGDLFAVQDLPDFPARAKFDLSLSDKGLSIDLADSSLGEMSIELSGGLPGIPGKHSQKFTDTRFSDISTYDGVSIDVQLAIPSLRKIPFDLKAKNIPDLPARVSGHIEYRDEQISLANVKGTIGESKFNFDTLLTVKEELAVSHIEFDISGPEFGALLPLDMLTSPLGKFSASGRIKREKGVDQIKNLEVNIGNMRARASGTVDNVTALTSANLSASIRLPTAAGLNGLMDQTYPDLPFELEASFSGNERQFKFDPMQAKLGPSDLSGSINLDLRNDPVIAGQVRSDFLDIKWLLDAAKKEAAKKEDDEDQSAKTAGNKDRKVFPEVPIPEVDFGGVKLDMGLAVNRLKLSHTEVHGVGLDLSLDKNFLQVNSFKFSGPLGESMSGELSIDARGNEAQLKIDVEGKALRLGLAADEDQDITTYPPTDLSIDIDGSGTTWHDMASSLDGNIRFVQGKGMIANAGMNALFSDLLTELINALNPFAEKSKFTVLDCSVANFAIESGRVLVKPMIFHTENITIVSGGEINLATENIDLAFQTKVRKGIGISAGMVVHPFIKVAGSLGSPTIELDPGKAAVTGTVAVATLGLSLIGKSLFDRFLSSKDPCGDALKKLKKEDADRK
jgi:uncharacterized protein involved in outer membrane biogenesis